MNARGCYGNNHFTRNMYGYGYALPYVGQEASPAPSRSSGGDSSVLSGGYSSVLGRILVIAAGAFVGAQVSSPGNQNLGMTLGAATAAFFNVIQRQANTLDRIADNMRRG
jgi:hypothetical protein